MKNIMIQPINRFKKILVGDDCGEVFDPTQGKFLTGCTESYIFQKERCGELVAYKEEGSDAVYVGFAIMHKEDMKKGYAKATTREKAFLVADKSYHADFYTNKNGVVGVPHLIRDNVYYFAKRIERYFKGCTVPFWVNEIVAHYEA
jgi:hypothetical protein